VCISTSPLGEGGERGRGRKGKEETKVARPGNLIIGLIVITVLTILLLWLL
jgi:hypothetical protein